MKVERRFLLNNSFKLFIFVYNPLILFLIFGNHYGIPKVMAERCKKDCCPTVWVEVLPAFIDDSPADHTYVKVLHATGKTHSWGCFGRKSGGKELDETKGQTHESNLNIIEGLGDKKPCKWDEKYYGKIGVCHQLANRALYFTGKTVKNAKMYKTSSALYGTYGNSYPGAHDFDMAECLRDKYKSWKDGYPPYCDREHGVKSYFEIDQEVTLFNEILGNRSIELSKDELIQLIEKYNERLTELYIKIRLGADYFHKFGIQMINYRYVMMKEREKLDQWESNQKLEGEDIVRAYNQIFNDYFDKHKYFMSKKEFFDFFGWDMQKTFDIRWLLEN